MDKEPFLNIIDMENELQTITNDKMVITTNGIKKLKNGISYYKNGWLYISVEGSPLERGYAYGCFIAKEMEELKKMFIFLSMEDYGLDYDFLTKKTNELLYDLTLNQFNEIFQEMKGMIAGINSQGVDFTIDDLISWNNIFLLTENIFTQFTSYGKTASREGGGQSERCSAFICTGEYSKNGKIVASHNNFSNFLDGQYAKQVIDIKPRNGNRMVIQGFIGFVWSGTDFFVTDKGIFGTETTIGGFTGFKLKHPIAYRIRKAMQYGNTLDEYLEILVNNNSGDYANSWLFGDTNTNEIVRLELGLEYHNIERTNNGYFIGHNAPYDPKIRNLECVNSGFNDIRRHNGSRKVRLTQLMKQYKGNIDLEIAKKIIADHYDVYLLKDNNPCSRTICSHYDEDAREFMSELGRPVPYQPRGAVDGNVIDDELIKNMTLCLKYGRSCDTPFFKNEFCDKHIQWEQYREYLMDRPNQPWTLFTITDNYNIEEENKGIIEQVIKSENEENKIIKGGGGRQTRKKRIIQNKINSRKLKN